MEIIIVLSGFTARHREVWHTIFGGGKKRQLEIDVPVPPKKKFRPKCVLPKVNNFKKAQSDEYWASWPKLSWEEAKGIRSNINPVILEKMAREFNYPYEDILRNVIQDLKEGASIGVAQGSDVPSDSTNAPSAYENGEKVTDGLCQMIKDGFVMGPLKEEEIPFECSRFSGLMVKLKPDNSARLILNLSKGNPHSVNSGIDVTNYPTLMSSTEEFVKVLYRCGNGAEITKCDWASAYKGLFNYYIRQCVG